MTLLKLQFAFSSVNKKDLNLFFCTRTIIYKKLLKNISKNLNMPFYVGYWKSGTLTNNLLKLKKFPDLIFIPDVKKNYNIVKESNFLGTPIFSLVSSDFETCKISYPIFANSNDIVNTLFVLRVFCKTLSQKAKKKIKNNIFVNKLTKKFDNGKNR